MIVKALEKPLYDGFVVFLETLRDVKLITLQSGILDTIKIPLQSAHTLLFPMR